MEDRKEAREALEKSLCDCESKLEKFKKSEAGHKVADDLDELESELKACRLELGRLEDQEDEDWLNAKHGIATRLEDVQRNLQLTGRRMGDYIR